LKTPKIVQNSAQALVMLATSNTIETKLVTLQTHSNKLVLYSELKESFNYE